MAHLPKAFLRLDLLSRNEQIPNGEHESEGDRRVDGYKSEVRRGYIDCARACRSGEQDQHQIEEAKAQVEQPGLSVTLIILSIGNQWPLL